MYFKLHSCTAQEQVAFYGNSISVADLRVCISDKKQFGRDKTTRIALCDVTTGQEYTDDTQQIIKNSRVIVKRACIFAPTAVVATAVVAPVSAPPPAHRVFRCASAVRETRISSDLTNVARRGRVHIPAPEAIAPMGLSEEDLVLSAAINARASDWYTEVTNAPRPPARKSSGAPPPNYTCHRCGCKGHWIQNCNGDTVRVHEPIGIPMERLAPSESGSLRLPSGQLATLVAKECVPRLVRRTCKGRCSLLSVSTGGFS